MPGVRARESRRGAEAQARDSVNDARLGWAEPNEHYSVALQVLNFFMCSATFRTILASDCRDTQCPLPLVRKEHDEIRAGTVFCM